MGVFPPSLRYDAVRIIDRLAQNAGCPGLLLVKTTFQVYHNGDSTLSVVAAVCHSTSSGFHGGSMAPKVRIDAAQYPNLCW